MCDEKTAAADNELLKDLHSRLLEGSRVWVGSERGKKEIEAAAKAFAEGRGLARWMMLLSRDIGGPRAARLNEWPVEAPTVAFCILAVLVGVITAAAYFFQPPNSALELGALAAVLLSEIAFLGIIAILVLKLLDRAE